jgi:transposase-like protein
MALLKIYSDENAAREHLESLNWPDGPICPHCGTVNEATKLAGKSTRPGVYKCRPCQKPFSVTVGTVFERSKIKLNVWVHAVDLYTASKKGFSAHQLHRTLGVTYKTAWFMAMRIREAMAPTMKAGPLGGPGKIVEADTTYIGGKEANKHRSKRDSKKIGGMGKQIVHTLVERKGEARSHHVANISGKTLRPMIVKHASRKSNLMTDTAGGYMSVGKEFARHDMVDHGDGEYVRIEYPITGEPEFMISTNTVESYFATLKRGINGVYHHVSEAHLQRYLAEFDFRYNERSALGVNDAMRAETALKGIVGKRLMYRRPDEAEVA